MAGSSGIFFARAAYEAGMITRGRLLGDVWQNLRFRLRGSTDDRADDVRRRVGRDDRGRRACAICSACRRACSPGVLPRLYPQMLERAYGHQDAGRPVYIVTAASQEMADLLAHVLAFDGGLGLALGGASTAATPAAPRGPVQLPRGQGHRRCASSPSARAIDLGASYAYSDSESDLPMLRAVGHPVVVNPDADLRADRRCRRAGRSCDLDRLGRRLKILAGRRRRRRAGRSGRTRPGTRRRRARTWTAGDGPSPAAQAPAELPRRGAAQHGRRGRRAAPTSVGIAGRPTGDDLCLRRDLAHCLRILPQIRRGKIRVVVAKPGLDGHDRGAKIIARALRDAGMEVIYTGLHQTPEQIVETVIQEDADAVGLSILSGAHMTLVPRVVELLREQGVDDVVVTVGGTIPAEDIPELKELGVAEVFTPGAPTQAIVDFIRGRRRTDRLVSQPTGRTD